MVKRPRESSQEWTLILLHRAVLDSVLSEPQAHRQCPSVRISFITVWAALIFLCRESENKYSKLCKPGLARNLLCGHCSPKQPRQQVNKWVWLRRLTNASAEAAITWYLSVTWFSYTSVKYFYLLSGEDTTVNTEVDPASVALNTTYGRPKEKLLP